MFSHQQWKPLARLHRTRESWLWACHWLCVALCITMGIGHQVCFSHYFHHPFLTRKICLMFAFYTISLQLNALERLTERECSSHVRSPFHSQHAKVIFPVMVSTVRCPDPVNASRCKRMRNPPERRAVQNSRCWVGKIASRRWRIPGSGYHRYPTSGILDKLPHSSSPSCHARYLLKCKVCLCLWQPWSLCLQEPCLLKHHLP